jgi:transcriptional regulator with XRE-family HTH domain
MDIAARLGDDLVRCRKLADLSQDELSVRASVHRTEISQLERGLRIARIDTLAKLCGSLEVEPSELPEGIKWSPGDKRIGRFRSPEMSGQRNEGGREGTR